MKIAENIDLIKKFSEYFNSRICVLEFLHIDKYSRENEIFLDRPERILLKVDDKETFKCLKDSEYFHLLVILITNLKLPTQAMDIFKSHFEDDYLKQLVEEIEIQKNELSISYTKDECTIVIGLPFLLREVSFSLISQLHTEFIQNYIHFKSFIKLLDGNAQSLYLNANGPTAFSQFIQMWVAESLKIPKTPLGDYRYL